MLDSYIGEKVRILKHFNNVFDDFTHITAVYATKDSIGTILSYEEYCAQEDDLSKSASDDFIHRLKNSAHLRHLAWVKSAMKAGTHYPIRFDEFIPLPEEDYAKLKQDFDIVDIVCHDGAVIVLPSYIFVFIERK